MENLTLSTKDYQHYFSKGMDGETYQLEMEEIIQKQPEYPHQEHLPLNIQRSKRIAKTIQLLPELTAFLNNNTKKYFWLAIAEYWCGDASQCVPVMQSIAQASNGNIQLKIVLRDENPDLINAHLTNGSKSIPILLQLDESFNVNSSWGPRPKPAQQLVKTLKANPETSADYAQELHKWYAQDKGETMQRELLVLLKS